MYNNNNRIIIYTYICILYKESKNWKIHQNEKRRKPPKKETQKRSKINEQTKNEARKTKTKQKNEAKQ